MRAIEASGLVRDLAGIYKEFRRLLALIILSAIVMLLPDFLSNWYYWIAVPVAILLALQTVGFMLSLSAMTSSIVGD